LQKVLILPANPTNISISIGIRSGRLISRDNKHIQVLISINEERVFHISKSA